MDFLKQWTVCVCATLVISTIFLIFSPKGSMKRLYKVMISMFIVISFIYPFGSYNGTFDFDFSFDELDFNTQTQGVYENMIDKKIKDVLNNNGYTGCNIESKIYQQYEEITIDEVLIYAPDEYDVDSIKQCIIDDLGIYAKVIHIGD